MTEFGEVAENRRFDVTKGGDTAKVKGSGLTSVRLLSHLSLAIAEDEKLEPRGHVIFRTGLSVAAAVGERMGIHSVQQEIWRSTGHMSVVIGDGWTIKDRRNGKGKWMTGTMTSHLWNDAGRRNTE